MRKTYTKVQSFPSPESDTSSQLSNQSDQPSIPKVETNLHQVQGPRISANRLFKILDTSIVSQKIGMKLAIEAISPAKGSNSDWKFINYYLDSTALLLEACKSIQLRLERIRNCLDSIPIGLHYLEGENEPSKAVLQQAAIALEDSRFVDKQNFIKMEKSMSKMRRFGKKLNGHTLAYEGTNDGISPDLFKALSDSWAMAVNAVGVLSSATSFKSLTNLSVQSLMVEPRTILLNEPNNKMKVFFQKKIHKTVSMEELARTYLVSQTLLKLISAWKKCGSSNLRRMAVKAVAGELRRRKEVLDKTLPLLEDKIEEFYQQIVAIRISMLGLIPTTQKEDMLEMVKQSNYEESQMHTNQAQRVKVKTRATTKSFSLGQSSFTAWSSFRTRVSNQVL